MADTTAPEKKKKNRRFPSIKSFPTKKAYYEHMIKFFQDKLADYIKFGDGDDKKKVAKVRKFIDGDLDAMMKDPKYQDLIMELRKKVQPPTAPVAAKK